MNIPTKYTKYRSLFRSLDELSVTKLEELDSKLELDYLNKGKIEKQTKTIQRLDSKFTLIEDKLISDFKNILEEIHEQKNRRISLNLEALKLGIKLKAFNLPKDIVKERQDIDYAIEEEYDDSHEIFFNSKSEEIKWDVVRRILADMNVKNNL